MGDDMRDMNRRAALGLFAGGAAVAMTGAAALLTSEEVEALPLPAGPAPALETESLLQEAQVVIVGPRRRRRRRWNCWWRRGRRVCGWTYW